MKNIAVLASLCFMLVKPVLADEANKKLSFEIRKYSAEGHYVGETIDGYSPSIENGYGCFVDRDDSQKTLQDLSKSQLKMKVECAEEKTERTIDNGGAGSDTAPPPRIARDSKYALVYRFEVPANQSNVDLAIPAKTEAVCHYQKFLLNQNPKSENGKASIGASCDGAVLKFSLSY